MSKTNKTESIWLYIALTAFILAACTKGVNDQEEIKAKEDVHPPELVIIPISAHEKGAPKSHSRFVVKVRNGQLVANGVQDMRLDMNTISNPTLGMKPNHWGLGAEHAFEDDVTNWGNGLFWADINADTTFPITFKVTEDGYVYLCGRGRIKIKDGKDYRLGYDIGEKNWIAGILSPHQLVREGSCQAAGRLGIIDAIPNLIVALRDTAWQVRRNACETLGLLGDTLTIKPLEVALKDENENVRKAAEYALIQLRVGVSKNSFSGFMYRTNTVLKEY